MMNRKEFLKQSVIASMGLYIGLPNLPLDKTFSKRLLVEIEDEAAYLQLLSRFAYAVGTSVVSNLVTDYIKDLWYGDSLKKGIKAANAQMANPRNGGFSNLRHSTVHQNKNRSTGDTIMYQAATPSRNNVCAPIFNLKKSRSQPITMLEGPTLAALNVVAGQFSKKEVANLLLPLHGRTQGNGSFEKGLARPAIYVSKGAIVKIDYKNRGRGYGVASVGVTSNGRRKKVYVDQDIDIYYS